MNNEINQKERKHSVGTLEDYFKRKRQEVEGDTTQDQEAFKRSKVTQRTPPKREELSKPNMERIEKLFETMANEMKEIKNELKETKNEIKETKNEIKYNNDEIKRYGEEIRAIKEELLKREVEWKAEKENMQQKIEKLEQRLESQERKSRRNNIVIKGANLQGRNLKEGIQNLIEAETGVKIRVEEVYKIGKQETQNIIVAKLQDFEQKIDVLKQKYKLGNKKIYIDSDLTMDEQKVQAEIRKLARTEKQKGNVTKVGYRKMEVNGKSYVWNEQESKLEEKPKN